MLGPAVAPWETTLPGTMGGKGNNPSVRLVQYDRSSGKVLDLHQYYLDLRTANELGEDDWQQAYQATSYYGIPDFSTESLEQLTERMMENDDVFDKYYKANGVFYDPDEVWDEEFRLVHYCSITQAQYEGYAECVKDIDNAAAEIKPTNILMLFVLSVYWVFKRI